MANPSRLKKVQITENVASATAPKVVVQESNGELNNQNINTAFNKNYGLGNDETISADLFKNQYSVDPVIWTATSFSTGNIVFYGGKQWIAESDTVAGDVPSVSDKWKEITFESLDQNKVNKSGIEVSLPILNADNEKVGEISHYDGYPVIKGESGVVLQGSSAIVSSLNGFDDYLVGVGLNGQLIPVRKESTSIYAPTANSTTVQNLAANVSTELLAKITLTLPLVNPTLQWSINVTNTGVQLAIVSASLGLDGVATGSPALYSVPKNTTMILSGASPYAANLPIGTILSTFLTSDRALRVNSITIKASSGIQSSTIDQTIIDGSTNAVSSNAVFDALALKCDIANQIEITTATANADASWHGKTVIFTVNCTVTVVNTVPNQFTFEGIVLPNVTVSWAIQTPLTWLVTPISVVSGAGIISIFTLMRRGSTNNVMVLGI